MGLGFQTKSWQSGHWKRYHHPQSTQLPCLVKPSNYTCSSVFVHGLSDQARFRRSTRQGLDTLLHLWIGVWQRFVVEHPLVSVGKLELENQTSHGVQNPGCSKPYRLTARHDAHHHPQNVQLSSSKKHVAGARWQASAGPPIPGRVPQILRLAAVWYENVWDLGNYVSENVGGTNQNIYIIKIRLVVYLTVGAPKDPIGNVTFLATTGHIFQ